MKRLYLCFHFSQKRQKKSICQVTVTTFLKYKNMQFIPLQVFCKSGSSSRIALQIDIVLLFVCLFMCNNHLITEYLFLSYMQPFRLLHIAQTHACLSRCFSLSQESNLTVHPALNRSTAFSFPFVFFSMSPCCVVVGQICRSRPPQAERGRRAVAG